MAAELNELYEEIIKSVGEDPSREGLKAVLFFVTCPRRADSSCENRFTVPESRINHQDLPEAGEKQTGTD